jgi:hypothetical protein
VRIEYSSGMLSLGWYYWLAYDALKAGVRIYCIITLPVPGIYMNNKYILCISAFALQSGENPY